MSTPVSVIILTYNEEVNIGRCLDSVSWCDDVVVLDSLSTDKTRDIARQKGARVVKRPFDNYANQRNYALKEIKYNYPWVLMLDADEVVLKELIDEIKLRLTDIKDEITLLEMRRKDYFFGRWLKYSSSYSSLWFGRLARRGHVWVERDINEEFHTDGNKSQLKNAIIHYPFNKGLNAWIEKHNRYSSMEAELLSINNISIIDSFIGIFTIDAVARRKSLKSLVYSLPGKPILMFFGRYIITGGFLDGRAGLRYCLLKTIYEYMIDCKLKELERIRKGLPI